MIFTATSLDTDKTNNFLIGDACYRWFSAILRCNSVIKVYSWWRTFVVEITEAFFTVYIVFF